MPLQIRRGTELERQALTSANGLVVGELLYVTDDQKLYIGNGTTPGGIVATSYNDSDAKSAAATALTDGTHEYITFTFNTVTKSISSTLDLSNYNGTLTASSFKGSVLADDGSSIGGVTLVDATNGSINLDGTVKSNIIPDLNISYDIGSNLQRFRDLYLSGSSIYLGDAVITATGGTVNLPAGSTIGGVEIGSGTSGVINADIVADDSTVLVNTTTKIFRGNLIGNVSGDLVGNVSGNFDGVANGSFVGNAAGAFDGIVTGVLRGDHVGSVFADDSSLLIDGTEGIILGNLTNDTSDIDKLTTRNILLEGNDSFGRKAGIRINTDGDLTDGYDLFTLNGAKDDVNSMLVNFTRGRGTPSSPTALQNGDGICALAWLGYDGDATPQLTAVMNVLVDGSVSVGNVPTRMEFKFFNGTGFDEALSFNSADRILRVANNTVAANAGSGTADVAGGVLSYLKITVGSTTYAMPLYGLVP